MKFEINLPSVDAARMAVDITGSCNAKPWGGHGAKAMICTGISYVVDGECYLTSEPLNWNPQDSAGNFLRPPKDWSPIKCIREVEYCPLCGTEIDFRGWAITECSGCDRNLIRDNGRIREAAESEIGDF